MHADGSVDVELTSAVAADGSDTVDGAGAAIGRLFFELLVGRAPLDRSDAFEPSLTAALGPSVCALIARSCSDFEGQWPSINEWSAALLDLAGGQATPPTAAERASALRRRILVGIGIALLVAISILVVLWAPGWWDGANEAALSTAATAQP